MGVCPIWRRMGQSINTWWNCHGQGIQWTLHGFSRDTHWQNCRAVWSNSTESSCRWTQGFWLKAGFPSYNPKPDPLANKGYLSCKATGLDGMSARLLKIAAPAVAPYHWPNLSTSVLLMVHFLLRGKRSRINPFSNFNKFRLTQIKVSINCFLTPSGSNNSH